MTAHAKWSPSSSGTWIPCSWSAHNAVPEEVKKQSTLDAAAEGTRVHAALQVWHDNDVVPPEDDAAHAAVAQWGEFVGKLEADETEAEVQVRLTEDCWGTVDLRGLHPRITTIMDAKNGKWDVSAYENNQMQSYAAMSLNDTPAEWFRLVIFQPNGIDQESGSMGFKQWVAHRSQVEAHRDRMLQAMAYKGPPNPGPHCRWCKAFQVCPAMSQDAFFVMGAMARDPKDLTPAELVRLLRLIRGLHDNKEAYEEVLLSRAKLGYAMPDGAGMKPKRAYRSWNDPIQAAAHLYQQFGGKGVKPVTPAQAEKLGPAGKMYASVGAHKPEPDQGVFY